MNSNVDRGVGLQLFRNLGLGIRIGVSLVVFARKSVKLRSQEL